MKLKTKRLSVCDCGFPVLKAELSLGLEYEIEPLTIRSGSLICGGCGKKNPIYLINAKAVESGNDGTLPAEIFWAPTDEPDTSASPAMFGKTKADAAAMILGTGFWQFNAPHWGGLMKWKDRRLDLLVIYTEPEGQGHLREFLKQAKAIADTICVWAVDNQLLVQMLILKYGFKPAWEILVPGEPEEIGLRWDKPSEG